MRRITSWLSAAPCSSSACMKWLASTMTNSTTIGMVVCHVSANKVDKFGLGESIGYTEPQKQVQRLKWQRMVPSHSLMANRQV